MNNNSNHRATSTISHFCNVVAPSMATLIVSWAISIYHKHALRHWNGTVVILTQFSLLAAPEVVKMTTSRVASDENFVKMTIYPFHCQTTRRFTILILSQCDFIRLHVSGSNTSWRPWKLGLISLRGSRLNIKIVFADQGSANEIHHRSPYCIQKWV